MNFKPNDFFIGVIDFFGILVPGATLLFLHGEWILGTLYLRLGQDQTTWWAAFLLGSYVIGHFILGMGVRLNKLLELYHPEANDDIYGAVKKMLPTSEGRTNAFYRAYAFVRLNSPSGLAEIERQMADYKLFRSLTIVFLLDLVLVLVLGGAPWSRSMLSVILTAVAAYRFLFLLDWTYRITFEYYALLVKSSSAGMYE